VHSAINSEALCELALRAGACILALRKDNLLHPERKDDGSPVTCADHEAQAIILEGLAKIAPSVPAIAEEQDHSQPRTHETYWLVDPLDGTRDFLTGRNDFSVNIGLVHQGVPIIGVIYAPARDDLFCGTPEACWRIKNGIRTDVASTRSHQPPRLVISVRDAKKNPIDSWLATGLIESYAVHASAYKMALVAAGEADLFLRTSVTSEWDTAAGDAILRSIGGKVLTPERERLAYGKLDLINGNLVGIREDFDWKILKNLGFSAV
jgi:3'(2'),5'-bisphosphate nucleotidase